MSAHRVYYGKGAQALVTVPHRDGRPVRVTAGTFGIFDARYGDGSGDHVLVAAGTAATVDAASTVLTARAGRGAEDRRTLTVVSTADFAEGHMYLLAGADGRAELVTVAAIASATVARTASEVRGDFGTGSTLRGVEVSATFPGTAADAEANLDGLPWVVVWTFVGLPPLREMVHLERGEEAQLATLADLLQLDPMVPLVGGDRVDPAAALARAHRDLRTDLRLAGAAEADLLVGPVGRDAVVYRAAYLVMHHGDDAASERKAADYLARYNELRAALVIGAKKPEVVALSKAEAAQILNPAKLWTQFGWGSN